MSIEKPDLIKAAKPEVDRETLARFQQDSTANADDSRLVAGLGLGGLFGRHRCANEQRPCQPVTPSPANVIQRSVTGNNLQVKTTIDDKSGKTVEEFIGYSEKLTRTISADKKSWDETAVNEQTHKREDRHFENGKLTKREWSDIDEKGNLHSTATAEYIYDKDSITVKQSFANGSGREIKNGVVVKETPAASQPEAGKESNVLATANLKKTETATAPTADGSVVYDCGNGTKVKVTADQAKGITNQEFIGYSEKLTRTIKDNGKTIDETAINDQAKLREERHFENGKLTRREWSKADDKGQYQSQVIAEYKYNGHDVIETQKFANGLVINFKNGQFVSSDRVEEKAASPLPEAKTNNTPVPPLPGNTVDGPKPILKDEPVISPPPPPEAKPPVAVAPSAEGKKPKDYDKPANLPLPDQSIPNEPVKPNLSLATDKSTIDFYQQRLRSGELNLSSTQTSDLKINGKDLEILKKFIEEKKLIGVKSLNLSGNTVTDKDLTFLTALPNLETLYLSKTRVTEAGVANLKHLKNLKNLYLLGVSISATTRQTLQKEIPSLKIDDTGR